MFGNLIRNWWAFVVQGALAIVVGLAAFLVPGPTLAAFLAVFAVYAIVTGALELYAGFSMQGGPKWSFVFAGVAAVALGILTIAVPQTTAVAATLLVGVFAIVTGFGRTAAAYMLGGKGQTWLLAISGIVSVVFGILLITDPSTGVLGVLWLIGWYLIFAGVSSISFGLRLRGIGKDVSEIEEKLTANGTTEATATSR